MMIASAIFKNVDTRPPPSYVFAYLCAFPLWFTDV